MKSIVGMWLVACVLGVSVAQAQAPPQAFNYSAVARDANGLPMASANLGIQIAILQSSATGASVYVENHQVSTDNFGLFNLMIGTGLVQSGNLSSINWGADTYFLQVGMDVSGGSNFAIMGTTQFLSVPYALHARVADSISGGFAGQSNAHYIGEIFGGGVIFHLWRDAQGAQHGLIVDLVNLSDSSVWSNVSQLAVGAGAESLWDGRNNSLAIAAQAGHSSSAASLCLNSTNGGQSDWYLPSNQELNLLWNNLYNVSRALSQIPGSQGFDQVSFWSSTEVYSNQVLSLFFHDGDIGYYGKLESHAVRAIRAF